MAYAESTIGGTYGNSFRVWVNSIRTRQGDANDNSDDWRCDGGVNRVSTSGGRIYNLTNGSTYTVQLGLNGVAVSGHFNWDSTGNGGVASWGTPATRVGRDGAGNGPGFTSRTDVNMANGPYVTSGWVQSSDAVATVPRHAVLTAISMDAGGIPFTDEGPAWIEFNNPSGQAISAFIDIIGYGRLVTTGSVGSRYNYSFGSLTPTLQSASPNSNTYSINIGTLDHVGGGDTYDYRVRTGTIKNDVGQANPTFTDFDYLDTNTTTPVAGGTVGVTGSNQVLVQGLSTLEVDVPAAKKATTNKAANRGSYNFTIGGYSGTATWPATGNVVQTIGTVSDVSDIQSLSVRAVDARGNETTVSKNVTVLPYSAPGFYGAMVVKYANGYDFNSGLTVNLFNGTTLGSVSAMTLSGTDKNFVNTTTGVKFDISKDDNTHYTGTKVNVAITNAIDHSGFVNTNAATLATAILNKMAALGQDNTTKWFITFEITDKFQTKSFTTSIDIGRPILRIGQDGFLYHNETEMSQAFNNRQVWQVSGMIGTPSVGTWGYTTLTGFLWAPYCQLNTSDANGDTIYFKEYLAKGTYSIATVFVATTNAPIVRMTLKGGPWGTGVPQYDYDLYQASTGENTFTLNNMVVLDAGLFTFEYKANGKNASSTDYYLRVENLIIRKTA